MNFSRCLCALLCIMLLTGMLLTGSGEELIQDEAQIPARSLTLDDTGSDVAELQTHLTELGYYTGDITGRYGRGTAEAVRSFQKDFGLTEDGHADIETLTLLLATQYRPLSLGISGEDVERLQTRLTLLGYFTGKVSGTYLEGTRTAVAAFQSKMGLQATGNADTATLSLLFSTEAVSRTGASQVTPAPVQDNTDIVDGNAQEDEPGIPFIKKLAFGASGKQVKLVQERLTELGYYTGPVSSSFQGHTRNAVRAFQKKNGLTVDGVVGEKTWNTMFNDPDVAKAEDADRPEATGAPVPFHIVVDVANQVVTVYTRDAAGEYTVVVRQMICSTGTKKNPSDIGDFVLSGRKARWCYFPKWGDYAQYWTKINGSIAFHSVIYLSVNTMSLSLKSYRLLGQRASHGCVRLLVDDAKWIYENIGKGTVVTITDSLPSDPELRASVKAPALNKRNMLPVSTPKPTQAPVYVSGGTPPMPLKKIQKGDSSESVYWLQCKLRDLGYYTGTCTGTYLEGTVAAVRAFQKDHGISVSGTADTATLEAVYADELSHAVMPSPSPVPAEVTADPSSSVEPVTPAPEMTPNGAA